jgi:DNA-binding NarL/FixJ family response regulator
MAKPVEATGTYSSKKRKAFPSGKIFLSYRKNDLSEGFEPMCKTLIVEDKVTFRQMLKESLCSRFPTTEIEEEPDGRDLFNKIDSFHFKIVFMDIRLPGENGLELTKKIKKNYPDSIIAMLTSYDLPEYRQAARESMADYFVPKGSSIQDFQRNTGKTGPG